MSVSVSTPDKARAKAKLARRALIEERHATLKAGVLDLALSVLVAEGHEALKARDLAEKVGCSIGTFYEIFKDMDEVAMALKSIALRDLDASLSEAVAKVPDGASAASARLQALALAYVTFARDRPNFWGMLFRHRIAASSLPDWYVLRLEAIFGHIDQPLAEIAPDADAAMRRDFGKALFSAVHGIVVLGLEEKIGIVPREALEWRLRAVVASVISGLSWEAPMILVEDQELPF